MEKHDGANPVGVGQRLDMGMDTVLTPSGYFWKGVGVNRVSDVCFI